MAKKKGTSGAAALLRRGEGFRKFQSKLCTGAILRAVLFGLSLGVMTAAVLLLIDKLTDVDFPVLLYPAVGGAVAIVGWAIMTLMIFPDLKRVAKHLDRSLSLGEKVQTMVAFRREKSAMVLMQRTDTDRILRETPKKRVKGVCTWLFAVLPVLAVLGMVGTLLVPAKQPATPPAPVDKTWHLKQWEEQALKDLIREVQASDMENTPKIDVVVELETLLKRLKTINKESAMKAEVISAIADVHSIVKEYNTYDLLTDQMALVPSAVIRDLGQSVDTLDPLLISESMQKLRKALQDRAAAADMAAAIRQAVQASGVLATNETIMAMNALADALEALPADADDQTVAALIDDHDQAVNAALALQAANETMDAYVMYELMSIFGIAKDDLPQDLLADLVTEEGDIGNPLDKDDEPEKGNSGGKGDGEQLFAGNDEIYDPESGTYVAYGAVLNSYYAKITEMLADGSSPEEIEAALSSYYTLLSRWQEQNKS